MIKALLFDKDGTLFDFNASWGKWAMVLIDELAEGDAKKREALIESFAFDGENERFLPHSPIIAGTVDEILAAILRVRKDLGREEVLNIARETTKEAKMMPVCDLEALFSNLTKRGMICGIATNDGEEMARAHIERAGVMAHFAFIAGYDSGYGSKPAPGMCEGFLRAHNIAPDEAIMVGDAQFDILAGKAAGMRTLGVLTGVAGRDELLGADAILQHIGEIPNWLDREFS